MTHFEMEAIINDALLLLAPATALAFIVEYVWAHNLESKKPKTGSRGQPLGTTPPGYLRDQNQIKKEAPVLEKHNEAMKKYLPYKLCFDRAMPFVKRFRLYSMVLTFGFGIAKAVLWYIQ